MDEHSKLKFFEYIPSSPDKSMIFTRLGYRKTTTVISDDYKKKLHDSIKQGLMLCNTKGVFGRFKILEHKEDFIKLENNAVFESKSLAKLLTRSFEVILMSATVGEDITERITREVKSGDAALGVVLDAVASETVDSALDWMVDFINKILRREGKRLTGMRYSPGYGDLPLSNQKIIFDILKLDKLGLDITEKYMLIPEKSVIAIAGVEGIGSDE